jgi:hypothetical protein
MGSNTGHGWDASTMSFREGSLTAELEPHRHLGRQNCNQGNAVARLGYAPRYPGKLASSEASRAELLEADRAACEMIRSFRYTPPDDAPPPRPSILI